MRADRRGRGGRVRLGGDATPSATPTSASSRSRVAEVEREHLGQDGRERRAVGQPTARPDRVAERVDEPDAGPARLADAGEVRGHQHLRARLEVRAVGDRAAAATSPTVRMTPSAIASANGFGLADSSDSSEWVIASIAGRGGRRRRQPDGQRRVEDRRHRQQRRMADVVLAAGRLVGDDAEAVASRRRSRRSSGRRRSGSPGVEVRAVVARAPRPAGRWRRAGRCALAVSIDEPPPTGDDDRARRARTSRKRRGAALDGRGRRGSARPRRRPPSRCRPPPRTPSDAVDDARAARRPGRSRRRRASRRPRRRPRGSRSIAPTPNRTRLRSVISNRPIGERVTSADLEHRVGRGVAPDRQPAPAAGGVEPALGRRAVGVLEDPDLVEVALVGVGDQSRARAAARRRT